MNKKDQTILESLNNIAATLPHKTASISGIGAVGRQSTSQIPGGNQAGRAISPGVVGKVPNTLANTKPK